MRSNFDAFLKEHQQKGAEIARAHLHRLRPKWNPPSQQLRPLLVAPSPQPLREPRGQSRGEPGLQSWPLEEVAKRQEMHTKIFCFNSGCEFQIQTHFFHDVCRRCLFFTSNFLGKLVLLNL